MFGKILLQMREKIRIRAYIMTVHAEEEMANDDLTIFDIEHAVLTGEIVERQRDEKTGEWKYVVQGKGLEGQHISLVARTGSTGKIIFITVYQINA